MIIEEKLCKDCGKTQPLKLFRHGRRVCRPCTRLIERARDDNRPGGKLAWNQRRYRMQREQNIARAQKNARAIRAVVLAHYGGICACCGEGDPRFITLDHVHRNGNRQRAATKSKGGTRFYYWVKKNGFPDDLRLLCYNCNMGREQNNGICPHEEGRLRLVI